jgi:hypothetical protein
MSDHNEARSPGRPLRDKQGLVNRVRRLRGQVDAIERVLDGKSILRSVPPCTYP